MHRQPLIQALDDYHARHADEAETTRRFRDFVTRHANCFDRELSIGHITGAAWIESHCGGRVLLLHHRKLDRWLQPGGHADGDADVLRVARKEMAEETGLVAEPVGEGIFDLDLHSIPARGAEPEHWHYDVRYRFRIAADARPSGNHESHALAWFDIAEVARWDHEPSLARMAIKTLATPL